MFTVCCLKKRYKTQKLVHGLLYSDQTQVPKRLTKKGINGPFIGSEDNLDKRSSKKPMPEIVISPETFESTNKSFSPAQYNIKDRNQVRFKEDGQQENLGQPSEQLPNLMSLDYNEDELESQPNELRSYKDALTFYNKNASKNRKPQSTNYSNRSVSSQQQQQQQPPSQRYSNNPLQQNPDEGQNEIVYSISSSYAQPGVQADVNIPTSLKARPVDENIYSQVVASSLRRPSNQADQLVDDQPVYMNTPYNLALQAELNKQDSSRTNSQRNFSYRDSSL